MVTEDCFLSPYLCDFDLCDFDDFDGVADRGRNEADISTEAGHHQSFDLIESKASITRPLVELSPRHALVP
jgi:hypothetical protein